ncbi:progestin and adipoQ receptor family member 3-like [Lineus longissimus]|uniref:progestin and adipoQ receptor family member 3-like n=1 Tax=Lineus longissimus TaxID=88925 RepID=UPI00315D3B17
MTLDHTCTETGTDGNNSLAPLGRYSEMENGVSTSSGLKNRSSSSGDFARQDTYHILDVEIDRGCGNGVLCSAESKKIELYKYNDIPGFLKGNPYVTQGYRAFLPFSACVKSLFVWNNETINVWSHLLGFVLFFFIMIYDNIIFIPGIHGTLADHVIITIGLMCYQFCMLCSAGYHIFLCHSERASRRWLAMDLAGICIGLIGCYLPAVHYAFYCLSIWRDIYLLTVFLLCFAVLTIQLNPRYFASQWWTQRVLLFCALVAYGIIPTAHWVYLNGGWSHKLVQMFAPKVARMYSMGVLAFVFYLTKFPERCFPGIFDFIGSSHQWWHLIVVVAFWYWHQAGGEILSYRTSTPCHV